MALNPNDPPSDVKLSTQAAPVQWNRYHLLVACTLVASFVAPFITSFVVMHSLVGIGNLKRHWWLLDGLILSLVLNGIFMFPLLFRWCRSVATIYIPFVAILVTLIAYFVFEYWMVALMGV